MNQYTASMILENRIYKYSIPITESGCWIWIAYCDEQNYGKLNYKGKSLLAHRASYEAFTGFIPDNIHVLHKCDTPSCVNPKHLYLGTDKDNALDRERKKRGPNSKKTHCKHGHIFNNFNTYFIAKYPTKRFCKKCASERQRIYKIRQRDT